MRILGLDVGGVIKQRNEPIPDAVESIKEIASHFDSVCVVSRINDAEEGERNLAYIKQHLSEVIPADKVFFCEKRHEKAPICERLGVTHFVDDRPEVLSHMATVPNKFALNPTQEQLEAFPVEGMKVVKNWKELLPLIWKYIPLSSCEDRYVYKINSRNLVLGVYNASTHGFMGIREKFFDEYLFEEYHWDCGPPYGTVMPYEKVEKLPDELSVSSCLYTKDKNTDRHVAFDKPIASGGKGWYFLDTGEASEQIYPVSVNNEALFEYLSVKEKSK